MGAGKEKANSEKKLSTESILRECGLWRFLTIAAEVESLKKDGSKSR
jgi:hypothetical protein